MAQFRLDTPAPFNFRKPDDWSRWKKRFEQYRLALELGKASASRQISTLLYCLGEEAEAVLDSTDATDDEKAVYKTVIEKFDAHFKVRKNIIYERAKFNKRNQQLGETAEEYIMQLYKLAEGCNYGEFTEEMIRDRLVVGIRDNAMSERLQLDPALTLDKAKRMIRQREAVHEQQEDLKGASRLSGDIDETRYLERGYRRKQIPSKRPPTSERGSQKHSNKKQCTRCGKEQHARDKCPAKDATGFKCNKKGHYSSQCYSKTKSEMSQVYLDSALLCHIIKRHPGIPL